MKIQKLAKKIVKQSLDIAYDILQDECERLNLSEDMYDMIAKEIETIINGIKI